MSFEWVKNRKVVEDLVKIWTHSRNKVKIDYWVRDAKARLATKYRNDMVRTSKFKYFLGLKI